MNATAAVSFLSRALRLDENHNHVLIFCDRRVDAQKVADGLKKSLKTKAYPNVEMLTDSRRVFERESLAGHLSSPGFVAGSTHRLTSPTFTVATSAGEVGIDLDADHMVCELVSIVPTFPVGMRHQPLQRLTVTGVSGSTLSL